MTNKFRLVTMLVVLLVALMQSTESWQPNPAHLTEDGGLPANVEKRQVKQDPEHGATVRRERQWAPQSTQCNQQPAFTTPGPDYEYFPGLGFYKFHTGARTWDQARSICEAEGAYLAIINCEEEAKVLHQLFSRYPKLTGAFINDYVFIGFHDRFIEAEYLTVQGKSLQSTGYQKWIQQPPNLGDNEDCGSIYRGGGLNDIPCFWNLAFICEHD